MPTHLPDNFPNERMIDRDVRLAQRFNAMREELERIGQGCPVPGSNGAGGAVGAPGEEPAAAKIWAQITAVDTSGAKPKYSWNLMREVGDGTFTYDALAFVGSPTLYPLYEQNGIATVPTGTIVEIRPGTHGEYFTFNSSGTSTNNIVSTPTPSADQDNYDITNISYVFWNPSTNFTLSGLTGGVEGRVIQMINVSAYTITIVHLSTSSSANQFYLPTETNFYLLPYMPVAFIYQGGKWRVHCPQFPNFIPQKISLTTSINNQIINFGGPFIRLVITPDAAWSITGFTRGRDGQFLQIINRGAYTITLPHESGSSTAANRINNDAATNVTIPAYSRQMLYYDGTASRWKPVNTPANLASSTGTLPVASLPTSVVLSGSTSVALGGTITGGTGWYKVTVAFGDLSVASTSKVQTLFTLPAGAVPLALKAKTSIAFAGPGIVTCTIAPITTVTPTVTLWSGPSFSLMTAVAKTVGFWAIVSTGTSIPSHSDATTTIAATFASGGANLDALTAGSIDIWLQIAVVP